MMKTEQKTVGDFESVSSEFELLFRCDECHKKFKGKEVVLEPYKRNMSMVNPMLSFKFFEAPDHFIGTSNTGNLDENKEYYTLHCPKCGTLHLFGMDMAQ